MNSNVDFLMPKIYSRYHDQFMRNYAEKNESKIMGVQRFVFCKHKSEYVFPCYLVVSVWFFSKITFSYFVLFVLNSNYDMIINF